VHYPEGENNVTLKVTIFYNQANQGWTETYYANGSNPASYLAGLPDSFYRGMLAPRDQDVDLFAIRATFLGTPRLSYSFALSGLYGNTVSQIVTPPTPDLTATDGLLKLVDGQGGSKLLYLRGLQDQDTIRSTITGASQPTANLLTNLAAYMKAVYSAGFQIRTAIRPPTGGLTWFPVTSVESFTASNAQSAVNTSLPTGFLANGPTNLVFQNVPTDQLPGFPKTPLWLQQIGVAPPYTVVIPYLYRANTPSVNPRKMRFCLQSWTYTNIFSWTFERFTTHKTGRPFGTPRGRARSLVRSF
jgi:hypothetical protein